MTNPNTSNAFKVAHTATSAVLGEPWISTDETLTVQPVHGWAPWNLDLHRDGSFSMMLRSNSSDNRATFEFCVAATDDARDVMASAVVSYVSRLGDFYIHSGVDPETAAQWFSETLDRIEGALTAARKETAERVQRANEKRAAIAGA